MPVQNVTFRVKRNSSGELTGIQELGDVTVEAISRENGAVVVNLSPVLQDSGNLHSRLVAVEEEVRQHRADLADHRAQLAILRNSNSEFAKILRRSLIDDVHKFLEAKAGPRIKMEDSPERWERWDAFVTRIMEERGYQWFAAQGFPASCLGLLPKGPETAFQQGSDAAHQLRTLNPDAIRTTYLEGLPDDVQGQWIDLFGFLEASRTM